MKTNKTPIEVFQFLNKQDWARELEHIILMNLGMTLASYIACCCGEYGRFFSEANVPMDDEWRSRSNAFFNFITR